MVDGNTILIFYFNCYKPSEIYGDRTDNECRHFVPYVHAGGLFRKKKSMQFIAYIPSLPRIFTPLAPLDLLLILDQKVIFAIAIPSPIQCIPRNALNHVVMLEAPRVQQKSS